MSGGSVASLKALLSGRAGFRAGRGSGCRIRLDSGLVDGGTGSPEGPLNVVYLEHGESAWDAMKVLE